MVHGPGAPQVRGFLACGSIRRTPPRGAVDGHHSLHRCADPLDPRHQLAAHGCGSLRARTGPTRVMRGHTSGHSEPCGETRLVRSSLSTPPAAPHRTPPIASMMLSRTRCCVVRSLRGSSTWAHRRSGSRRGSLPSACLPRCGLLVSPPPSFFVISACLEMRLPCGARYSGREAAPIEALPMRLDFLAS